jgi:2-oxoglutarate ferredoxin oxidoreductase subunit beta
MEIEHPILKYLRKELLPTAFCADCGCGTILNVFANVVDSLEIDPKDIVLVTGIGCASWIPSPYFKADTLHTTHGRPITFATGVKVMKPDMHVIVIAGDGDIAAIGGNHLIHAARRNIGLTVFLVNNFIYGMTGGQFSPTTPTGTDTTTTPYGNPERTLDIAKVVAAAGADYVARWTTLHVNRLHHAMQESLTKRGFSFVEIYSQCPTSFGRKIGKRKGIDFLEDFKKATITKDGELGLGKSGDGIVIGKFVDQDNPEFTDVLRKINDESQKDAPGK